MRNTYLQIALWLIQFDSCYRQQAMTDGKCKKKLQVDVQQASTVVNALRSGPPSLG